MSYLHLEINQSHIFNKLKEMKQFILMIKTIKLLNSRIENIIVIAILS